MAYYWVPEELMGTAQPRRGQISIAPGDARGSEVNDAPSAP